MKKGQNQHRCKLGRTDGQNLVEERKDVARSTAGELQSERYGKRGSDHDMQGGAVEYEWRRANVFLLEQAHGDVPHIAISHKIDIAGRGAVHKGWNAQ